MFSLLYGTYSCWDCLVLALYFLMFSKFLTVWKYIYMYISRMYKLGKITDLTYSRAFECIILCPHFSECYSNSDEVKLNCEFTSKRTSLQIFWRWFSQKFDIIRDVSSASIDGNLFSRTLIYNVNETGPKM